MSKNPPPVRDRLLQAGARLFAEHGFEGASVREICEQAGASSRMIHHYFGSKRGLYDAIIANLTQAFLQVPIRIIAEPAESRSALVSRFEIFFAETLHAVMTNRDAFAALIRENVAPRSFAEYYDQFTRFFRQAQADGLVRGDIDPQMVSGLVLDRAGNQVTYADAILDLTGRNVFTDEEYRREWVRANTTLILNGILPG